MFANKIKKPTAECSKLEKQVAQEIANLQQSSSSISEDLKPLQILAAREVQVDSGRKAVIIFFPARDLSAFRAIQKTLVEELEKKFGYVLMPSSHFTFSSQPLLSPCSVLFFLIAIFCKFSFILLTSSTVAPT